MRIKTLVYHGLDATIRAHPDDIKTFRVGTLEHPVLPAELGEHAVDRALGTKGFAAGDAMERHFFLQHAQRRVPRLEIEAWLKRDNLLGTGRFAKPALHAEAFGKAQHRAVGIVRERTSRAGGDTSMAKRAAVDVQFHAAERCARR